MATKVIVQGTQMVSLETGRNVTMVRDVTMVTFAPNVYMSPQGRLYTTRRAPSYGRLETMEYNGIATTPCGCKVEPDGTCSHGIPSWLRILDFI